LLSTLQQIQQTALAAATLNGQTALVQGASASSGESQREYVRCVLRLFTLATLGIAAIMLAWPAAVARLAGLPGGYANLVRWAAIPVILSSAFTFLNGLLRVAGEIGRLASIQVLAALAMALAAWPAAMAARAGHTAALVAMLGISAGAALWAAAMTIGRRRVLMARWFAKGSRAAGGGLGAARHFFSVSGAMLATSLMGSAALLAVRGRVTRISGSASTGAFDAAWGISMNHVTLILSAMQVYYLPVLAAAGHAAERRRHIANGLMLAICAGTPVMVGIALAKPALISMLYSSAFEGAARYLRWTLIGDYLKLTSWVLAIPMLAAADMRAFVAADVLMQTAFWGGAWLIGRVAGPVKNSPAEAAAIAFTISYAVNFGVCYAYARRRQGFRFGRRLAALWIGGLTLVSAASLGVAGYDGLGCDRDL
jgi:PST family polysaccharide transporter